MKAARLLFIGLLLAINFQSVSDTVPNDTREGVVHTVFLWLKQPGNVQHRRQLIMATGRLRDIPGVLEIRFGETIESERVIVDDSFDVGIYFYFADVAAMNRYLVHPLHTRIVNEDIKPLVSKIRAHDFYDQAPGK